MKPVISKYLRFSLVLAALLIGMASQVAAYNLSVYPDTLRFTSNIGQLQTQTVSLFDNRDTNGSHTPLTQVSLAINGSPAFFHYGDSLISFFGYTTFDIHCSAGKQGIESATLTITDNKGGVAHVVLINTTPGHQNLWIGGNQDYDTLTADVERCNTFTVDNPNSFAVTINDIADSSLGTYYHLNLGTLQFPMILASKGRIPFDLCVNAPAETDTDHLSSEIYVLYNYGTGNDVASWDTHGTEKPGHSSTCLLLPPSGVGAREGDTESFGCLLTNLVHTKIIVDSAKFIDGGAEFSIQTTFPFYLDWNMDSIINLSFMAPKPATQNPYYGTLAIWSHGSNDTIPCNLVTTQITGTINVKMDSIYLDVPPSEDTLSITTNTILSNHALFFRNVSSGRLKLLNASVPDSNGIAYFGQSNNYSVTLDDTVNPGQTDYNDPILSLDVPDTGTYNIDLMLNYENALQAVHYTLQAHRIAPPASAVTPAYPEPSLDFTMNPNPAHDEVTISLPSPGRSTVEIYDVLGNLVLRQEATAQFTWNCKSSGDANGNYIVRVVNRQDDGSVLSISKRLVVVR